MFSTTVRRKVTCLASALGATVDDRNPASSSIYYPTIICRDLD